MKKFATWQKNILNPKWPRAYQSLDARARQAQPHLTKFQTPMKR